METCLSSSKYSVLCSKIRWNKQLNSVYYIPQKKKKKKSKGILANTMWEFAHLNTQYI